MELRKRVRVQVYLLVQCVGAAGPLPGSCRPGLCWCACECACECALAGGLEEPEEPCEGE